MEVWPRPDRAVGRTGEGPERQQLAGPTRPGSECRPAEHQYPTGRSPSAGRGRHDFSQVATAGGTVNHKRGDRLYTEAQLQLRRRTRKPVPVGARQPLVRPDAANEVWSMACVVDRRAEGRGITCVTIVDDATHESLASVPERPRSGAHVTRILDQVATTRRVPQVIRTAKGKEFCGRAMLTWAHAHTVTRRLIAPGKPTQTAYIESFHGRFRDECLNEHWFLNLAHAQAIIEAGRREYNDERPKKAWGGLTPAA